MPQIAAAIRASVNRHTGFTPNKLMLGREVNMPLELMFAQSGPTQADLPIENYVAQLQQDMLDANQQAREVLKTSQKRMKVDYDVKSRKSNTGRVMPFIFVTGPQLKAFVANLSHPGRGQD